VKLFSGLTRSELMSRIRSRGNKKTELAMVLLLRKNKITGWRRHQPLPGTPDFVFPKSKLIVFVDGCFWHGCKKHGIRTALKPFWKEKFIRNKARDRIVNYKLRKAGWRVIRVWEHELTRKNEERLLRRLSNSGIGGK
jgi:DNA mismatch endonuclease (patch repair protein)